MFMVQLLALSYHKKLNIVRDKEEVSETIHQLLCIFLSRIGPNMPPEEGVDVSAALQCEITHRADPECSIRRLLLMSYFPSGFWSRLITRILADDAIVHIVRSFFIMPKEVREK
jgi:hypothetical protein